MMYCKGITWDSYKKRNQKGKRNKTKSAYSLVEDNHYYAQLHYNICTHCLFMHQARLQVADFSADKSEAMPSRKG